MNVASFLVLLLVAAALAAIAIKLVRDRKRGKSGCSGNCSACGRSCPSGTGENTEM